VLAGAVVVVVVRRRVERRQLLQPDAEVVVQAALGVDEDAAGDVHAVHQAHGTTNCPRPHSSQTARSEPSGNPPDWS
jgi:hypothetical protein